VPLCRCAAVPQYPAKTSYKNKKMIMYSFHIPNINTACFLGILTSLRGMQKLANIESFLTPCLPGFISSGYFCLHLCAPINNNKNFIRGRGETPPFPDDAERTSRDTLCAAVTGQFYTIIVCGEITKLHDRFYPE